MPVERLRPAHAELYRGLMLQAYTEHPEAFSSSPAERSAWPLARWQQRLAPDPAAAEQVQGFWLAENLCGVVGVSFQTREKLRHKCQLFGMVVVEAQRRQGLGRALLDASLQAARQRPGVRLMQLSVSEGNVAALALYERAGFQVFGREPMAVAVGEGFVTKLHLWRTL